MSQMQTIIANSSHASPGNYITGTSGASIALSSSLLFLTTLRVLDLSSVFTRSIMRSLLSSHKHPDNLIGIQSYHYCDSSQEEEACAVEFFCKTLARLQKLESLDLRGLLSCLGGALHACVVLQLLRLFITS